MINDNFFKISGIQNNIDKLDNKIEEEIKNTKNIDGCKSNPGEESSEPMENKILQENSSLVPKLSKMSLLQENSQNTGKKDSVTLHLELKKAYDFSPPSDLPNKR